MSNKVYKWGLGISALAFIISIFNCYWQTVEVPYKFNKEIYNTVVEWYINYPSGANEYEKLSVEEQATDKEYMALPDTFDNTKITKIGGTDKHDIYRVVLTLHVKVWSNKEVDFLYKIGESIFIVEYDKETKKFQVFEGDK